MSTLTCVECDITFNTEEQGRQHYLDVHEKKKGESCKACYRIFAYPGSLARHAAAVHPNLEFCRETRTYSAKSRHSHNRSASFMLPSTGATAPQPASSFMLTPPSVPAPAATAGYTHSSQPSTSFMLPPHHGPAATATTGYTHTSPPGNPTSGSSSNGQSLGPTDRDVVVLSLKETGEFHSRKIQEYKQLIHQHETKLQGINSTLLNYK